MKKVLRIMLPNGDTVTREFPANADIAYLNPGQPLYITWADQDHVYNYKDKIYLGNGMVYWELKEVE